MIKPQWK